MAGLRSRVDRIKKAIRALERASKAMEGAYRVGEFGERENPLAALDVALANADDLLRLMEAQLAREGKGRE